MGQLLVVARRALRGVPINLGPVNGDHLNADQTRLRAQRQHLAEQPGQRHLMTLTKARDRAVIGLTVGRDHPKRDVLKARTLDHPRGALPTRIRVHQQRDHHRRIMRRPAAAIQAVIGVEGAQVHPLDHRDHKPREVILTQPFIQTGRQQEHLPAITPQEALRHPRIL